MAPREECSSLLGTNLFNKTTITNLLTKPVLLKKNPFENGDSYSLQFTPESEKKKMADGVDLDIYDNIEEGFDQVITSFTDYLSSHFEI